MQPRQTTNSICDLYKTDSSHSGSLTLAQHESRAAHPESAHIQVGHRLVLPLVCPPEYFAVILIFPFRDSQRLQGLDRRCAVYSARCKQARSWHMMHPRGSAFFMQPPIGLLLCGPILDTTRDPKLRQHWSSLRSSWPVGVSHA